MQVLNTEGANPLSLGVWHFTLRFVLPRSWVGYPSRRPKGCGMQSPSGPKVYPKSEGRVTSIDPKQAWMIMSMQWRFLKAKNRQEHDGVAQGLSWISSL